MEKALSEVEASKAQLLEHISKLEEDHIVTLKLISGSKLHKYTSKAGRKHERFFALSQDLQFLQWNIVDSSRKLRQLPIDNISQIVLGNSEFTCNKLSVSIKEDPKKCCFSVITQSKRVHIVCASQEQRDLWVRGLSSLVSKPYSAPLSSLSQEFSIVLDNYIESVSKIAGKKDRKIEKYNRLVSELVEKIKELEEDNRTLSQELFETNKILQSTDFTNKDLTQELSVKNFTLKEQELNYNSIKHKHAEQNNYLLSLESKLTEKENNLIQVENEFREFKRQIKDSFSNQLVEKVNAFRKTKDVMCAYAEELKSQNEEIHREVAMWKSVVFHFVLPSYQAKKIGAVSSMKEVLSFALDSLEQKFSMYKQDYSNVINKSKANL